MLLVLQVGDKENTMPQRYDASFHRTKKRARDGICYDRASCAGSP